MPAVICLATPADADAIVAVFCDSKRPSMPWLEETYAPAEIRSYVADVLLKTTTVWVAVQGGEIVGYAALHSDVLEQLFVAADFQQQGIGGQLLDAAQVGPQPYESLRLHREPGSPALLRATRVHQH